MSDQERIAELEELNRRLSNQIVSYSDRVQQSVRPIQAAAWDEGFRAAADGAAKRVLNPYRAVES